MSPGAGTGKENPEDMMGFDMARMCRRPGCVFCAQRLSAARREMILRNGILFSTGYQIALVR